MRKFIQIPTSLRIALILSFSLYIISLFIVFFDRSFNLRWIAFWFHIISVTIPVLFYFKHLQYRLILKKKLTLNETTLITTIIYVALIVSIIYLQNYPYVSVGDGLRDSGLDAMKISNGTLKNIFGYGNYKGYGNIIPVFASFFYKIFGSSVMTYRVPSAIISVLDIALIYLLLRNVIHRSSAFLGALAYTFLPLHIFMARIELVLIFDCFWTSIIFSVLYIWGKRRSIYEYILLGLVLGASSNFHTSVRVVAVLVLFIIIINEIKEAVSKVGKVGIKSRVINMLIMIIFCFVGFGPMLLFSNSSTFLQSNRSIYSKELYAINYNSGTDKFETIKSNYIKSVEVWFYESTTSRYGAAHKPILTPFLALMFLTGIIYSFFVLKKLFSNILIIFVFLLPLTNSAMTDWVNADHRLAPYLPIAAIFIGLGFEYILQIVKIAKYRLIIVGLVCIYLFFQVYQFFSLLPANLDKDIKDYLSMNIIYHLKSEDKLRGQSVSSCIYVSSANFQNLNYAHYKEQYEFFVPYKKVYLQSSPEIQDNEAYVFNGACPVEYKKTSRFSITNCTLKKNLYCPIGYTGNIVIHY